MLHIRLIKHVQLMYCMLVIIIIIRLVINAHILEFHICLSFVKIALLFDGHLSKLPPNFCIMYASIGILKLDQGLHHWRTDMGISKRSCLVLLSNVLGFKNTIKMASYFCDLGQSICVSSMLAYRVSFLTK